MTAIPDDILFAYADRVKDKVVIITGGANGIGKETALRFASYGAKVVIGDLDVARSTKLVSDIEQTGGQATSIKCDVTQWDDTVALFQLAIAKYGQVDIVVPNAGISEAGDFETVKFKDGIPIKPGMLTIEVNLLGVLYTTHLAQHYLLVNQKHGDLKAIVLIGSMASWSGIPKAELYTASKHAVLGMMRSLHIPLELKCIRIAVIHPFFADTAIVPIPARLFLAGIPLTPVPRIGGAIFYAATNPDPATNGCAWLLPDNGPVFLVPKEEFKLGVYKMIDDRVNSLLVGAKGLHYYSRLLRDLWSIAGKPIVTTGLGVFLAKTVWDNKELILHNARTYIPQ
ncbi:hypothetical protein K443DRAFT_81785 [Laccaria amethystina LaAM-08-1]|uniref:NAD(P)-binding protein n=1 Tax=Laccaria amethystina LaAM-08-1 TaxID=1095629 RepID=A0A0C9XXX7_9AGAR|nr:hypothetical protein K443DRAFT_81785 [Laccaria amethystina LaAM-08-1]